MGLKDLFKKKKKEEVININIISDDVEVNNTEIEEKTYIKKENNTNVLFSILITELNTIKNNFVSIYHEYFTCKIFSRVALKDVDFNAQIIEIDKYINTLKKSIYDLERNIEYFKRIYGEEGINDDINSENKDLIDIEKNKIFNIENEILLNEKIIKQRFLDINNSYYGHLKISTVAVCMNKNNNELEEFYESISNCIMKYKNMTDCAEDIFYSSGDFITKLIKQLIKCVNMTNNIEYINKYDLNYFLKTDIVITLEIKEWIDLFNKVKFVFKLISDIKHDEYIKMKEKYNYFETIYTILMMRYEVALDQGKSI